MVDTTTIFSSPLSFQVILPFLFVFILVFAVLDKSKILGDGKRQVNVLLSLVIGLIVVSFGSAVYIINNMVPFLAVSLVIILVFLILVGALYKEDGINKINDKVKLAMTGVIGIAVVVMVLYITGTWNYLYDLISGDGTASNIFMNIVFIVIAGIVVAVVVRGGKGGSS